MSEATFLRLLPYDDKVSALASSLEAVRNGQALHSLVYVVDSVSFGQIPGSSFAYWVSEQVRKIFNGFSALEGEGRTAKKGITTSDDFRFVRLCWEVRPEDTVRGIFKTTPEEYRSQTYYGKRWIPFAKGGSYSPYYADIHLVVNWEKDAEELRNFRDQQTGKAFSYLRNMSFQFHPGLTWSIKNRFSFKPRPLNAGCIFSHVGATIFVPNEADLPSYLALLSSSVYTALLRLTSGWNFEVGNVQNTPIPNLLDTDKAELKRLALASINTKRVLDQSNEESHIFHLPELLSVRQETLTEGITEWKRILLEAEQQLNENQQEINEIAFRLYEVNDQDRRTLEETISDRGQRIQDTVEEIGVEEDENGELTGMEGLDTSHLVTSLLSYIVGAAFGRWDIRLATCERPHPELPDPFAPLPVCSPGMLIRDDGLPLREMLIGYPLGISWEGILIDDSDHPEDIVHKVRDVFRVIWQERGEAIEQEARQILGIKELREYLRRPGNGGFWMDHVKRYSKSRRKAPIYWLLQSSKRNYGLWLYYHRLDSDMLFKALTQYVEPKIRLEEGRLEQIRTQLASFGTAGREVKQLERQFDRQENLVGELYTLCASCLDSKVS